MDSELKRLPEDFAREMKESFRELAKFLKQELRGVSPSSLSGVANNSAQSLSKGSSQFIDNLSNRSSGFSSFEQKVKEINIENFRRNLLNTDNGFKLLAEKEKSLTKELDAYESKIKKIRESMPDASKRDILGTDYDKYNSAQESLNQTKVQMAGKMGGVDIPSEKEPNWLNTFIGKSGLARLTPAAIGLQVGMKVLEGIKYLSDIMQDAIMNTFVRQRAALSNVVQALPSEQAVKNPLYTKGMEEITNKLSNDKILTQYGMDKEGLQSVNELMRANSSFAKKFERDVKSAAEDVITLGVTAYASGMGLQKFVENITDMQYKFAVDQQKATNIIFNASEMEKKMKLEPGLLVTTIKSVQSSLNNWNFGIETSAGLAERFADDLQKGRISISDIVNYAKGLKTQNEGQQVFTAQQLANQKGKGGDIGRAVLAMSGGNPLSIAGTMRAIAEGNKDVFQQLIKQGVNLGTPGNMAGVMNDEVKNLIKTMAQNIMPSNNEFGKTIAQRKVAEMMGYSGINPDLTLEMQKKMWEDTGMPKSNLAVATNTEKMKDLMEKMLSPIMGMQSDIKKVVNSLFIDASIQNWTPSQISAGAESLKENARGVYNSTQATDFLTLVKAYDERTSSGIGSQLSEGIDSKEIARIINLLPQDKQTAAAQQYLSLSMSGDVVQIVANELKKHNGIISEANWRSIMTSVKSQVVNKEIMLKKVEGETASKSFVYTLP